MTRFRAGEPAHTLSLSLSLSFPFARSFSLVLSLLPVESIYVHECGFVHFFFHVTTAGTRADRINISHRRFDLVVVVVASSSVPSKVVLIVRIRRCKTTEFLINLPFLPCPRPTDARVCTSSALLCARTRERARASDASRRVRRRSTTLGVYQIIQDLGVVPDTF